MISTLPLAGAAGVALNAAVSATFSEPMDSNTLTVDTFTLTVGNPAVLVVGTVTYGNSVAQFVPMELLAANSTFTATLTTGAQSAAHVALGSSRTWTFVTGNTASTPVNLGTAGNFVVLAKTGISTVPGSAVTGNMGVSPAAATYITGFSLIADGTNTFAISTQVVGNVYASDYADPTPANLTSAVSDMETAFTDAASRAADVTELGSGDISGMTLPHGVYKWGTGVLITSDVTLTGKATDVWIFEIAGDLTVANGAAVTLAGGALPKNVFWQVSGFANMGTTSHMEGVLLCQTGITLETGSSINGRLLAQTAVIMDMSTVTAPAL